MRPSLAACSSLLLLLPTLLISHLRAAEATGFIRVEQIDGVWWFIDAQGNKFVSIGVNHIEPHLWLAPYNKQQTLDRYGADMVDATGQFNTHGSAAQKWIEQQIEYCRDLDFNTFGKHIHPSVNPELYQNQIKYIVSLETAPLAGWQERKGQGPRPDVFSADFRNFLERRVREVCCQHKESRNLLGYVYTDVPSWVLGRSDQKARNEFVLIYPWINAILALGESSPGKLKWIEHLKTRYSSAREAAAVWGLPVSRTYGIQWEQMARLREWSQVTNNQKAIADQVAFMYLIADKWYGLHREIIRKHDPNHLLFGDKNILQWHYEWVIPALKKHVDVIAIQSYGRWAVDGPRSSALYEQIGKPIFNGDGCYGFAHPQQKQWGVKGFRTNAENIAEVASFYRETVQGMMSAPFMVGWHHCGYIQQWDEAERGDSPRNENGFFDPFENEITEWTDVIREMNSQAFQLHEQARN